MASTLLVTDGGNMNGNVVAIPPFARLAGTHVQPNLT